MKSEKILIYLDEIKYETYQQGLEGSNVKKTLKAFYVFLIL